MKFTKVTFCSQSFRADYQIAREEELKRFFYIAGVRHYIGCDGDNSEVAFDLNIGDTLSLEFEPTNKYDENAIKIMYNASVRM